MVGWQMGFYGGPGQPTGKWYDFFGFLEGVQKKGTCSIFWWHLKILKIHHIYPLVN